MNNKSLGLYLGLVIIASVFAALPQGIGPLSSNGIIYVDDDNTSGIEDGTLAHPYNTIYEGVNAALPGDTVYVFNGTYYEIVVIDKILNLEGEDKNTTFVDTTTTPPYCDYPCITVVANDSSVSGFTTLNGDTGIALGFSSGCSIFSNILTNTMCLQLFNVTSSNIYDNTLSNTSFGIFLTNSDNNAIASNDIQNVGFCVKLSDSPNNIISQNKIINGGFAVDFYTSHNNIISNNLLINCTNGVQLLHSNSTTISENTFLENIDGISMLKSNSNTILHNNFTANYNGIDMMSDSGYNIVENNLIKSSLKRGIDMSSSSYNTFSNNSISEGEYGIYSIFDSNYNTIFNNSLYSNSESGMYLGEGTSCIIANNTIYSNQRWGILMWSGDFNNNLIINNYIHSNVEEGIYIGYNNYDNLIYHNHFEANNNATNVFDANHTQAIDFGTNFWDNGYPSGGNYWSDWLSPDAMNGPAQDLAGADGIVDLPYELDTNTVDNYPLTKSPLGPQGPPVATIDIDPDTLNLKSKGKWITCYIELPSGYDPRDINASTILLNGTIPPELNTKYGFVKSEDSYIMDHDNDTIEERMVKFNRSAVQEMIGAPNPSVELIVTGELYDGTPFEGSDVIRAIHEP